MSKILLKAAILIFLSGPITYSQDAGTFIKIKDSRIHYDQRGSGHPAVIFVAGLGEAHDTWKIVQDSISSQTLTVSYDRSGLGKSEYHNEPKDLNSLAEELKHLITSINVPAPYILVGHSLGCQIIKQFAALYPTGIKGLIFLDPGYNEELLRARLPDSIWRKRDQALHKYLPKFNAAQQAELNHLNANCESADRITALPTVPIMLFTATLTNPSFPGSGMELQVKQDTHKLWLESLPQAEHIEVDSSRHYIQNDAPEVVIHAIERMAHDQKMIH